MCFCSLDFERKFFDIFQMFITSNWHILHPFPFGNVKIDNLDFQDQISPKTVFSLQTRTNKHNVRIFSVPILILNLFRIEGREGKQPSLHLSTTPLPPYLCYYFSLQLLKTYDLVPQIFLASTLLPHSSKTLSPCLMPIQNYWT